MASGRQSKPRLHKCLRPTLDGTPCQKELRYAQKCGARHRGGPQPIKASVAPSPRPTKPTYIASFLVVTKQVAPAVSRTKTAVEVVQQLADTGWQKTASQRLSSYLGQEAYTAIDRRWKPTRCKKLAEVARALSSAGSRVSTLSVILDQQAIKSLVPTSELAQTFVRQVNSLSSPLGAAVNGLRVSGIILCMVNNCIVDCECLKDFAKDFGVPALQSAMDSACSRFFSEYLS